MRFWDYRFQNIGKIIDSILPYVRILSMNTRCNFVRQFKASQAPDSSGSSRNLLQQKQIALGRVKIAADAREKLAGMPLYRDTHTEDAADYVVIQQENWERWMQRPLPVCLELIADDALSSTPTNGKIDLMHRLPIFQLLSSNDPSAVLEEDVPERWKRRMQTHVDINADNRALVTFLVGETIMI